MSFILLHNNNTFVDGQSRPVQQKQIVQMVPFKTLIKINRKANQAVYLQISNQIIELIKTHVLSSGSKLPSSRGLAELLGVHRKTIIACYEELLVQGWLISVPKKGTFVHSNIPILKQRKLRSSSSFNPLLTASFKYQKDATSSSFYTATPKGFITIKDGVADTRLAPIDEITQLYRSVLNRQKSRQYIGYDTTFGNPELREVLVTYLKETRGLNITKDNILITRGSQMGMFLSAQLLIKSGDSVVVGATNYSAATRTFQFSGAKIHAVPVDKNGLDTNALEALCLIYPIQAVYVTPHHHHPTTVTLSAERRMHLLNLAQAYGFAIIEDDYDYDFHYNHAPILPLASHDKNGHVIYVGSFCKTVAPVYRIGYLIAPKEFVDQCAELRSIIDRQGDSILELTFAHYIKNGSLDRHIRRVLKIYRSRRDLFCETLRSELGENVAFTIPLGGMAIWLHFNKNISLSNLSKQAAKHKLNISGWERYYSCQVDEYGLRVGFAAYDKEEILQVVSRLKKSVEACLKAPD